MISLDIMDLDQALEYNILSNWMVWAIALVVAAIVTIRGYVGGAPFSIQRSLCGEIIVITGANSGLGYEFAKKAAEKGATVVLACRNKELGHSAVRKLRDLTRNEDVRYFFLDLEDFNSVREFARWFQNSYDKLHVLVNNAGVMVAPLFVTSDNVERHMSVNFLGPFLLTSLLKNFLRAAGGRVVNVTCSAYRLGRLELGDLRYTSREYNASEAYSQSKLAVTLMTVKLSRLWPDIAVNAVNPGVSRTNIHRYMPLKTIPFIRYSFLPFFWLLTKTPQSGSQPILYAAFSPDLKEKSGLLFMDNTETKLEADYDDELLDKLYQTSLSVTGLSSVAS